MDLRVKVVHKDTGKEAVGSDGKTQSANRDMAIRQLIHNLMEHYGVNCESEFYLFDDVKLDAKNHLLGQITRMDYDEGTREWKYQVEIEGRTDPDLYNADQLQIWA